MIIGLTSTKEPLLAEQKDKMAATAIHCLTLDPMGKFIMSAITMPIGLSFE